MDDLYKTKYRVPSTRLAGWDYGSDGLYYITICTKNRMHYFGEIVSETDALGRAFLKATAIGNIAHQNWLSIPQHFSFVELG